MSTTWDSHRKLLHPESVSAHSVWYNTNMPSDRGLGDIDLVQVWPCLKLFEHRTGGYRGTKADNWGVRAVQTLASNAGLEAVDTVDSTWGLIDTRHLLWLVYHVPRGDKPLVLLQMYETPGNISPYHRPDRAHLTEQVRDALRAAVCGINLPARRIPVDAQGAPLKKEHATWLRNA